MSRGYFTVAPRYTPGSPALVQATIALRVAAEEAGAIEAALGGFWGDAQKARAERLGLRGIVEEKREIGSGKKHGWDVLDLCTGERFFRLTPDALRKHGWRSWDELAPWERELANAVATSIEPPKSGYYKIEPDGSLPGYGQGYKAVLYEPELTTAAPAGWKPIQPRRRHA